MRIFLTLLIGLWLVSCADNQPGNTATTTRDSGKENSTNKATATRNSKNSNQNNKKSQFDFYVLALSWSPDFCADNNDPQQCSLGKKLGFVLHGLWPQYNSGYPSNCSTEKMPAAVKAKFPNLYPNQKLYDHEWSKHGTCASLTPEEYLALSKSLKDSVTIPKIYKSPEKSIRVTPKKFKQDIVAANSALSENSLAVNCSGNGRFLTEMFVCFSIDGQPTACSQELHKRAARSCQNPDFLVRNVR